jgi:hypothetical protein
MRQIKKYLIPCIAAGMLLVTGCKKYLDVNQNLNSPTSVPLSTLLTSAEQRIGSLFAIGSTVGNATGVYTHQLMQYGEWNRYGQGGGTFAGTWSTGFSIMTNLDVIIADATSTGRFAYAGIAKVLKAYLASMMVDLWGDMPYSEFNKFKEGIKQPKFDDDATIYPKLITLINEGIADIQNTAPQAKPGQDDLVYKGDLAKWVKAANTIKLKMYTQVRLVQNVATDVTALLANPAGLINSQAESFLFPYGPFTSTDDRYPGYSDYAAAQRGGQIPSHWLYEIMKGYNGNINTGLEDPRLPYYFYKQKTAAAAPENCTDYRDGGFITMMFGSNGPCVGGSNSNTYTLMGIYPIGGKYDDNTGAAIPATSAATAGTGAAPQRALTYADRLFLEAELINVNLASGNARNVFSAALDASFAQVDYVITTFIKPIQTVPVIATLSATTVYKTGVLTQYDNAATPARRLEHIMTQKWLSRLGNSVDNYTDFRRTKYPLMFNPAPANGGTTTSVVVPGGTAGIGAGTVQVSNGTEYPLSLLWSQTEINQNSNAPTQKVPSSAKVFWLP